MAAFKEPTWNYPVSRVIDTNKLDVAPRSTDWRSSAGLVNQITKALKTRKKIVPGYIELLALNDTASPAAIETAVFGMT